MATSGVGILALIGGTRLRKKTKGAGVSQFQVHDSYMHNMQLGV